MSPLCPSATERWHSETRRNRARSGMVRSLSVCSRIERPKTRIRRPIVPGFISFFCLSDASICFGRSRPAAHSSTSQRQPRSERREAVSEVCNHVGEGECNRGRLGDQRIANPQVRGSSPRGGAIAEQAFLLCYLVNLPFTCPAVLYTDTVEYLRFQTSCDPSAAPGWLSRGGNITS